VDTEIDNTSRPWRVRFRTTIVMNEGLSQRERIILFNSARRCEVHKLLEGEIEIKDVLR